MKRIKQEKRPSSDNFVDVHIFVVPHELWMEKYRTTYNNSTLESVSAGFVRVPPILSMVDLRIQIKEQLGGEDVIPEEYVFLRCVGRCLAIVSKAQEFSLKVKHFIPPVVPSPEIFVLFGTHENLSNSLASSLNTASDLPEHVTGYLTYTKEMDDGSVCSSRSTGEVSSEENHRNDTFLSEGKNFEDTGHSRRHVRFKKAPENNMVVTDHNKNEVTNNFRNKTISEENERQVSHGEGNNHNVRKTQETYLTEVPHQPYEQQLKSDSINSRQRRQTPSQTSQAGETTSENRNLQHLTMRESATLQRGEHVAVDFSNEKSKGTTGLQKNIDGDKQASSDAKNSTAVNLRDKITRKNPLNHSKTAPALLPGQFSETNSGNIEGIFSETEKNKSETTEEKDKSTAVKSDGNKNINAKDNLTDKNEHISEKNNDHSEELKSTNAEMSDLFSKELGLLPASNKANKIEINDGETDLGMTIDDKKNLILQLQAELNAVRSERSSSEKTREQLLKKAKNLQNQNNQKRSQAKNIWKKRYFEEKKITVSLEERCNQLRYEVDVLHKKLLSSMDPKEHETTRGNVRHDGDPDKVNNKILLTRKENEVEELKRRVEEAKIKLGSEMKLRDNAQKELKQIRDEVIDKKINATLVKKSLSLLETRPNNI